MALGQPPPPSRPMQNSGTYTQWSHENFLALPQQGTQRKLQQAYASFASRCWRAIQVMSAARHGASAFLHTLKNLPGCLMSNQEFEIAVKLRLGSKIHHNLPEVCSCGAVIHLASDHLLKCKWVMNGTRVTRP